MLTRRPAHPAPPPLIEGAKRLEFVRTQEGIPSLRGFWARLGGKASGVSYESVRNYHYDRPAPAGYLLRVTQVFPRFSLNYLAGGTAHPTEAHAETSTTAALAGRGGPSSEKTRRENAQRTIHRILDAMGVPQPDGIPYWAPLLTELRGRVWWNHTMNLDPSAAHEDAGEADTWVGEALRGPLVAFGIDPAETDNEALGEYIVTVTPALLRLADEMKAGNRKPERLAVEEVSTEDGGYAIDDSSLAMPGYPADTHHNGGEDERTGTSLPAKGRRPRE